MKKKTYNAGQAFQVRHRLIGLVIGPSLDLGKKLGRIVRQRFIHINTGEVTYGLSEVSSDMVGEFLDGLQNRLGGLRPFLVEPDRESGLIRVVLAISTST